MKKSSLPGFNLTLDKLKYKQDVIKAELSLYEFFKQSWSIIEGKTPFIENWHVEAIAEHLEACFYRQIKNLLINVPPRTGKSSLISIAFPAWVWLHNSEEKFMYSSYSGLLSRTQALKCRNLIESSWYKERWGKLYQFSKSQKAKGLFENSKGGYRFSTSVGATTTGLGGGILIADDPNNVKDLESEAKRESANMWWSQTWSTRLNNPRKDVRIVVQQRSHEQDISGYVMADDPANEWAKLIISMEFEAERKCKTVILPSTNGKIWEDPRIKEGELLCPARFSIKEINRYKRELGAYGYANQYQQRGTPQVGGIIKKAWFKFWKDVVPPDIEFVIQSWDTALTAKEMSSYSACTTWGVFYDHNYVENIILLSMWRDRLEYPELRDIFKRLYFDYRDTGKERNTKFIGRKIDMCLVEAKASGEPLMQDMRAAGIMAVPFIPNKHGDKIERVRLITPLIEQGLVWLPAQAPIYDKLLPFADTFRESIATFPNSDSRDLVDTMTQALIKLKQGQFLTNPKDEQPDLPSPKEIRVY